MRLEHGGGWRVEGGGSPLQGSGSFQTTELSSHTSAHRQTLRYTQASRACSFPEPRLLQDGENSPPPPPPTPRPQSAFLLPPSRSRALSSVDLSQQPSSPAVDSAPASSKLHSVIFIFGVFFFSLRPCLFMTVVLRER